MAELPLSQTVDASRSERAWRSSILALTTSTIVQGLVITTLIVTPLLVTQALPEPVHQLTLPPFVHAHVPPPAGRAPERSRERRRPVSTRIPRVDADVLVPPPRIPDEIRESDVHFGGTASGVPFGLPPSLGGQPLPAVSEPEADAEPEPIAIVGNVRPPRKVVHVDPVYPPLARAAGVQGTVKLRAVIDAEGRVSNVEVLHSVPLLDRAAIDAVQQWRYQPTLLNGRAVPVIVTVDVEFKLRS